MELLKIISSFLRKRKAGKETQEEMIFNSLLLLQGRLASIVPDGKMFRIIPRPPTYTDECYVMGRVKKSEGVIEVIPHHKNVPIQKHLSLHQISAVADP